MRPPPRLSSYLDKSILLTSTYSQFQPICCIAQTPLFPLTTFCLRFVSSVPVNKVSPASHCLRKRGHRSTWHLITGGKLQPFPQPWCWWNRVGSQCLSKVAGKAKANVFNDAHVIAPSQHTCDHTLQATAGRYGLLVGSSAWAHGQHMWQQHCVTSCIVSHQSF